jgi:hypothetical protein
VSVERLGDAARDCACVSAHLTVTAGGLNPSATASVENAIVSAIAIVL